MEKRTWLALSASTVLVLGLPGRAVAQINGLEPRNPYWRQLLSQKAAYVADQGLQLYGQQADLGTAAAANAGIFITFDVPGSLSTVPFAINDAGAITGDYCDAVTCHGFLRASNGTITTFDAAPGTMIATFPSSINQEGAITGAYCDAVTCHGFLRASNGTIATFDAATGTMIFTQGTSINPAGAITGSWADGNDPNFLIHGFLRASNGTITTFDAPGAVQSTFPLAINPAGAIAGTAFDSSFVAHIFMRAPSGSITTLSAPGAIGGDFYGTPYFAVSPEGAITSSYFQPIAGNPFGGNFRGFLRAPDGTFATVDAATYAPCCIWTFPAGITPGGAITGSYNDGFSVNHGFLRALDGTITTFDVPGAGTSFNEGTVPSGINPAGVITGFYFDAGHRQHGFLRN
jgi:hypothetical protein